MQEFQVVSNDCGQVLVVIAVSVPVEVGAVLQALRICDALFLQLLWNPACMLLLKDSCCRQALHLGAPALKQEGARC